MSMPLDLLKRHKPAVYQGSRALQSVVDSALFSHGVPRRDDGRWDLIALDVREKANDLLELADFLEEAEEQYRQLEGED